MYIGKSSFQISCEMRDIYRDHVVYQWTKVHRECTHYALTQAMEG